MNALMQTGGEPITMTSLELVQFINNQREVGDAELRHDDFMRKVPKVLGEGGARNFADTYQHAQNGQTYPCYRFPKREACLMAMSYSYDLQAKVFDRMTALEAGPKSLSPANLSRLDLLQLAMQSEQERLQLEVEKAAVEGRLALAAPKAEALDRIATFSEGSYCMRDAAKVLQVAERKFIQYLDEHNYIFLQSPGQWRVYAEPRKAGLMEQKTTTGQKPDGTEWQSVQVRVTAKGMTKLARVFAAQGELV